MYKCVTIWNAYYCMYMDKCNIGIVKIYNYVGCWSEDQLAAVGSPPSRCRANMWLSLLISVSVSCCSSVAVPKPNFIVASELTLPNKTFSHLFILSRIIFFI